MSNIIWSKSNPISCFKCLGQRGKLCPNQIQSNWTKLNINSTSPNDLQVIQWTKNQKSKTILGFIFSAITSKLGKNVPNTFSSNWSNQSSIKQHLSILIHPISLKMLKIKFSQIKVLANNKKIGENQSN